MAGYRFFGHSKLQSDDLNDPASFGGLPDGFDTSSPLVWPSGPTPAAFPWMQADPAPLANAAGGAGATEAATPAGGAFAPETVTLAGSGLTFINTYDSSVSSAYRTAILFAEHELQS